MPLASVSALILIDCLNRGGVEDYKKTTSTSTTTENTRKKRDGRGVGKRYKDKERKTEKENRHYHRLVDVAWSRGDSYDADDDERRTWNLLLSSPDAV